MGIVVTGKVWKFGNDINTDYMAPSFAKNMEWQDAKKTILHVHKGFTQGFQEGDVIVAGSNFGCGSSREAAPLNLKKLGVGCVIAESFGRIFFRNSVGLAFPVVACRGITQAFDEGDRLELDFDRSLIKNLTKGTEIQAPPYPPELIAIVQAGGIMGVLKAEAGGA